VPFECEDLDACFKFLLFHCLAFTWASGVTIYKNTSITSPPNTGQIAQASRTLLLKISISKNSSTVSRFEGEMVFGITVAFQAFIVEE
jgi:hypothetical protein